MNRKILKGIPTVFFFLICIGIYLFQIYSGTMSQNAFLLIPGYVVLAFLMNSVSYYFVARQYWPLLFRFRDFISTIRSSLDEWKHQFKVCVTEEVLWRFLPILILHRLVPYNYVLLAMIPLTVVFTAIHFQWNKPIYVVLVIEFFAYFMIVTVMYFLWSDILLLVTVHMIRNQLINFCRMTQWKLKKAYP